MKKLENSSATESPEATGVDHKLDSLIDSAPYFEKGIDAVKSHIDKVVDTALQPLQNKYRENGAKQAGFDDACLIGDEFPFQRNCFENYREVITRIGKTISGIVKREKDAIDQTLYAKLPNLEAELEQKIDLNKVRKLMKAAEALNTASQNANKFLRERGYHLNGIEAGPGHAYDHRKFWLPLLGIFLIEMFANYLFLEGAVGISKLNIALAAVVVIFGFGFAISWCIKAERGIRIMNNRFVKLQKILCACGVTLSGFVFFAILVWFILYRAGINPSSVADVLPGIAIAFSNNIADIGLAVLNVFFLGLAFNAFHKSGWKIRKYGEVAKDIAQHEKHYDNIRDDLNNQARFVFEGAKEKVESRRKDADNIASNWKTIVNVCNNIHGVNQDAITVIEKKYKSSIKHWRTSFKDGRNPKDLPDLIKPIPEKFRVDYSIDPLEDDNTRAESRIVALEYLRELDLEKRNEEFKKEVGEWNDANNKFDKFNDFAERLIKKLKEKIHKDKENDGIESHKNEAPKKEGA